MNGRLQGVTAYRPYSLTVVRLRLRALALESAGEFWTGVIRQARRSCSPNPALQIWGGGPEVTNLEGIDAIAIRFSGAPHDERIVSRGRATRRFFRCFEAALHLKFLLLSRSPANATGRRQGSHGIR